MTQRKMELSSSSSFSETRNNSIEQREVNPVTSMSTKLHEIILKDKIEEVCEAEERIDVTCLTPAAGQQSQPERKKAKGHQILLKAPKPHEKYFEGYLVMGRIALDYPLWPDMIRKPCSANIKDCGYTKFIHEFKNPVGSKFWGRAGSLPMT